MPRVDGVDLWPVISGVRKAARSEIQLSTTALVSGRMKLVRGKQEMTGWTGAKRVEPVIRACKFACYASHLALMPCV